MTVLFIITLLLLILMILFADEEIKQRKAAEAKLEAMRDRYNKAHDQADELANWIISDSGRLSRDWPAWLADQYFEQLVKEVDQK